MTDLSAIARTIEGAARDLEIDNALEAYSQALTLECTMKRLSNAELRIVMGAHYDNYFREHMEARLMQNTMNARRDYEDAAGIEPEEMPEIEPVNPYHETQVGDYVGD